MTEANVLMVAAIIIIIEWVLPLPARLSPLRLCFIVAQALALKVNKTNSTAAQRTTAGFLALSTYLLIIGTLVWAFLFIMPHDWVTQGVLLYLSMGFHADSKTSKHIQDALRTQQKSLARTYLSELTSADTRRLSPLGITKATLESTILLWVTKWLIPITLFISIGGLASLCYALVSTAVSAWPVLDPKFKDFGRIPHRIKHGFDLVLSAVLLPLFSIFKSSPGWLKITLANRAQWPEQLSINELLWLSLVAAGCKIEMAGPVMYNAHKVERVRLKAGAAPDETAIAELRHWQHRFTLFVIVLCTLFWSLANYQ